MLIDHRAVRRRGGEQVEQRGDVAAVLDVLHRADAHVDLLALQRRLVQRHHRLLRRRLRHVGPGGGLAALHELDLRIEIRERLDRRRHLAQEVLPGARVLELGGAVLVELATERAVGERQQLHVLIEQLRRLDAHRQAKARADIAEVGDGEAEAGAHVERQRQLAGQRVDAVVQHVVGQLGDLALVGERAQHLGGEDIVVEGDVAGLGVVIFGQGQRLLAIDRRQLRLQALVDVARVDPDLVQIVEVLLLGVGEQRAKVLGDRRIDGVLGGAGGDVLVEGLPVRAVVVVKHQAAAVLVGAELRELGEALVEHQVELPRGDVRARLVADVGDLVLGDVVERDVDQHGAAEALVGGAEQLMQEAADVVLVDGRLGGVVGVDIENDHVRRRRLGGDAAAGRQLGEQIFGRARLRQLHPIARGALGVAELLHHLEVDVVERRDVDLAAAVGPLLLEHRLEGVREGVEPVVGDVGVLGAVGEVERRRIFLGGQKLEAVDDEFVEVLHAALQRHDVGGVGHRVLQVSLELAQREGGKRHLAVEQPQVVEELHHRPHHQADVLVLVPRQLAELRVGLLGGGELAVFRRRPLVLRGIEGLDDAAHLGELGGGGLVDRLAAELLVDDAEGYHLDRKALHHLAVHARRRGHVARLAERRLDRQRRVVVLEKQRR